MTISDIIELNRRNVRQALADYGRHTDWTAVLEDVSEDFILPLAEDSTHSKSELRELFRKSPVWNEELRALVINGTRTHNPDPLRIRSLVFDILDSGELPLSIETKRYIADFFIAPDEESSKLEVIRKLAPNAYAPGKKLSRVFKSLCDALHVTDDTAGSRFQRLYAQFADELTAKKIEFKLYASINPAHFLTMSNPKCDRRGSALTSCHSFNSTEYEYNCGCSGYARDKYTFIVFTAANPNDPETLNNRKTTRQIFAYKPGNGVLLQSRLYNTSGGTHGAQEESRLYRDLIQREISDLEGVPNLWKTYSSENGGDKAYLAQPGEGFGGYSDWTYGGFDGKISIRSDRENDCEALSIGTYGLCIRCGTEISERLYCGDCGDFTICYECGDRFSEDRLYTVYSSDGTERSVCEYCRDEYYEYCEHCETWYPCDYIRYVNETYVCEDCFEEYYERCDCCDEFEHTDHMFDAVGADGSEIRICQSCADDDFVVCPACNCYVKIEDVTMVLNESGDELFLCPECRKGLCGRCADCGELYLTSALNDDGLCHNCAAADKEREAAV